MIGADAMAASSRRHHVQIAPLQIEQEDIMATYYYI